MAGRPGVGGRKPKPTALKVLTGNPGKRPLPANEIQPPTGVPVCPSWLSREAKAEWRRVVPVLASLGILTTVDRCALAAYCAAWARLVEAERLIAEHGQQMVALEYETSDGQSIYVRPAPNPALAEAAKASGIIRQFCSEFGLTPSSRSRIQAPEATKSVKGAERLLG